MGNFEMVDGSKGLYKETKTKTEGISLQHVRRMIKQREDQKALLDGEIAIWQAKEADIMALPDFEEPELEK